MNTRELTMPKDEAHAKLHLWMSTEAIAQYRQAALNIQLFHEAQDIDYDNLADEAAVYQLPITMNQLKILKELLIPLRSDEALEAPDDRCVSDIDNILDALDKLPFSHVNHPFLSIYTVHQCYGGPEEGGWWYRNWSLVSSVAIDEYEQVKEELRSTLEWYGSQEGNKAAPDLDDMMKVYRAFDSGALYHAPQISTIPTRADFISRNRETVEILVEHYRSGMDDTYVVFEWTPGSHNTTRRPIYC